jgi:endoglucanase
VKLSLFIVAGLLLAMASVIPAATQAIAPLETKADEPQARTRLARGINIPKWYWLAWGADPEKFLTDADAAQLVELGFTHARIPVDPAWLWDVEAGALKPESLESLRRGIDRLTAAGLAAIVEVHPLDNTWPSPTTEPSADRLRQLWRAFAPALADTDPGAVLLELLNEPHDFPKFETWLAIQRDLHAIVRAACPKHTIVLTGDRYGSVEGLLDVRPLEDPNVVYSFHIYDPHSFTHQGADWGPEHWKHLKSVPFPGTGKAMDDAIKAANGRAKSALQWYARESWDEAKLRAHIEKAINWGKAHNVQVYCGEFGVHRPVSDPADRRRWIQTVVTTLEEHECGWAVWEYVGTFGVMEGSAGQRRPVDDVQDLLKSRTPARP